MERMELMMHEDEYLNISTHERQHWWYRSLHQLVLLQIEKYSRGKELSIIDAGCGTGGLMLFLQDKGYKNVKGFDVSETAVQICLKKGLDVFKGNLYSVTEYFKEQSADIVISNDTFYFFSLSQQRDITNAIHVLLKNNGLLIVNIPALKAFRGIHDLRVGIKERLSEKNISKIFDDWKYDQVEKIYWPFLLSPFIGLSRYIQRLRIRFNNKVDVESDVRNEGKVLNRLLYFITDLENRTMKRKPFGSSLLLVLKKK